MGILVCFFFLACAAAFAQNAPGTVAATPNPPEQNAGPAIPLLGPTQWKAALEEWKQKTARLNQGNPQNPIRLQEAPVLKPSVCAVPLLNVVPPGTQDKMPAVQPPIRPRESGDTVKVPAPACGNGVFGNLPRPQIERVNP